MNPNNGLKVEWPVKFWRGKAIFKINCFVYLLQIRPFREAHLNRGQDKELKRLSKYLEQIAQLDDFSSLDHNKWEKYKSEKRDT